MTASVQAVAAGLSFTATANHAPSKSSQGSASRQFVTGPLKSQFFGVSIVSQGCSKPVSKVRAGSSDIVSASFFEKLSKLFTENEEDVEQVIGLYEFNLGDRKSPVVVKYNKGEPLALGDFVPYTNKVYDCSGKRYMGISAGLCTVTELDPTGGCRFETTMSHYLDGYGHISCQGPYITHIDSQMVVTGGTGIFCGARGWVNCHPVDGTLKLLYTYHIKGIAKLPADLTKPPVDLEVEKKASNNTVSAQKVEA